MTDIQQIMQNPFKHEDFDVYEYWDKNKIVGKFGVPYLDRELVGISKSDLVLIGARSGAGKTSLAKIIYEANDKTKTALFSLENYQGDLEMSLLRKEYNIRSDSHYDARHWQTGKDIKIDNWALSQSILAVREKLKNSYIFGRTPPDGDKKAWNIETLTSKIIWCATHGIELIIIDHLDYLDRDNPNESDNSHITELMKALRSAQEAGSAIVAFSHLRKPMGKTDDLIVPNENEFIGSSNKVKQATQVVLFAPANDGDDKDGYGTWCCIRKNRNGGIKNHVAKLYFIPSTESYLEKFEVYTINYAGTKISSFPIEENGGIFDKNKGYDFGK